MKKIVFNKFAVILVLAMSFTACNDDFLEQKNPNELTTDLFWKDLSDLSLGLNAVYNGFKDGNLLRTGDEYVRTDMCFPGYGRPTTNNIYYLQSFNSASDAPNKRWSSLYTGIFRANQVIKAYDRIKPTLITALQQEQGLQILAQARALRGLFYFYLHGAFNKGSVPIIDFVPESKDDFFKALSSAEEVRAFFTADLEFAMQNLPKTWNTANLGRVTQGAAVALLGQSYLYAGDYTKAAEYFKKVINDYGYALTTDIGSNFNAKDEFNSESILEINYSVNHKNEIDPYSSQQVSNVLNTLFSPVGGYRGVIPAAWLVMEYKKDPIDRNDPRNIVVNNGVSRLRKYSLRTSNSIALVDDVDLKYYGLTTAQAGPFNNLETAYWRKYTNWETVTDERLVSTASPRSGINVRLIRLADVYLMYAECLIKGGTDNAGVDEAMLYINKVRYRSALQLLGLDNTGEYPSSMHNNVTYIAKTLMDHLMYIERPLELSAEGNAIRLLDMRRWGITKKRFQDLATKNYYAENFVYKSATTGEDLIKYGSVLKDDGLLPANPSFVEFKQSGINYIEDLHAYWPLPNSEVTANPKL